jgi:thiol:disulfide interchange protein DsbC
MQVQELKKTAGFLVRCGLLAGLFLASTVQAESRWYDPATVDQGATLFEQNCASCHGLNAEGTADWKKTDADGNYPPPPLNGSAHAWHHSKELLTRTIREGGAKLGGSMPAFAGKLTDREIEAVIAYFQSKWPDPVYQKWASANEAGDLPAISNIVETLEQASATNKMTALLKQRLGNNQISDPVLTPVEGLYETQFGANFGYLSKDGRYIIVGNLIDLQSGQNLTNIAKGKAALAAINKFALEDKAVFPAIGEEKAVLNIFTDTSCPYCQKLHAEVPNLQAAGISVHYLPFPRGGSKGPGYATLKQVWCASDRAEAMNIAKGLKQGDLPAGDCADAELVDKGYALGNRAGVTGTPALYKSNGEIIQGYVPYQQLIPRVLNN